MARVSYTNLENPDEQNRVNQAAILALDGKARMDNSSRILGHIPFIGRFLAPLMASIRGNGAGSILPAKLKALVEIKTSITNSCAY